MKIAEKNKQLNKTKNEELVAKILKLLVRIFNDLLQVDTQQILQQLVVKQDSSFLKLFGDAQALYATLRDVDGEHKPMAASGIMDVFCSMVTLLKIPNFGFTVDGVVEKVAKMVDASGTQCKLFKTVCDDITHIMQDDKHVEENVLALLGHLWLHRDEARSKLFDNFQEILLNVLEGTGEHCDLGLLFVINVNIVNLIRDQLPREQWQGIDTMLHLLYCMHEFVSTREEETMFMIAKAIIELLVLDTMHSDGTTDYTMLIYSVLRQTESTHHGGGTDVHYRRCCSLLHGVLDLFHLNTTRSAQLQRCVTAMQPICELIVQSAYVENNADYAQMVVQLLDNVALRFGGTADAS